MNIYGLVSMELDIKNSLGENSALYIININDIGNGVFSDYIITASGASKFVRYIKASTNTFTRNAIRALNNGNKSIKLITQNQINNTEFLSGTFFINLGVLSKE